MNYWQRFLIALKTNRCPILTLAQQKEEERKERLRRLYGE